MSDYETTQRRRSMIVGVFVIIAVIAFFWMVFKFGDLPGFVSEIKSFEIRIQFPTAPGVQRDTPVRLCGYQIGTVTQVNPPTVLQDLDTKQSYYQTLVIVSIDNRFKNNIPDNVTAKLVTRGLGSSYIDLEVLSLEAPKGKVLVEGSLLQGSTGVSNEFFPAETQKKLEELIVNISEFVKNSNEIVGNSENQSNLKATLANLAEASNQAIESMKTLKEATAAGRTMIQNVDNRTDRLTESLVVTSDKLAQVMTNLDSILVKINEGQGTAGKLVNDGRLYEQFLQNSKELDILLKEIRLFVTESKKKGIPFKLK